MSDKLTNSEQLDKAGFNCVFQVWQRASDYLMDGDFEHLMVNHFVIFMFKETEQHTYSTEGIGSR